MEIKCLNAACPHHLKGKCKLFPGEKGWLECNFHDVKTSNQPKNKKGK